MNKQQQIRAEREGRGQGARETYVPYIQVRRGEFSSRGRSHIFPSALFNRHQHLLSDLELHALWLLQTLTPWDIREQFPLQWFGSCDSFADWAPSARGTVEIARSLGFAHPSFAADDYKRMTTDFIVQHQGNCWRAYHVKYEAQRFTTPRYAELLAIEEAYWSDRGIELLVITEQHVHPIVILNLGMALSYDRERLVAVRTDWRKDLSRLAKDQAMSDVTRSLAELHGGEPSQYANLIKYGIATGLLRLDLSNRQLIWSEVWPVMES